MNKLLTTPAAVLVFLIFSASARADGECLFPDSQHGDAPGWLCDQPVAGWRYLGQGDKSHMPSISLQNRLAGKQAMRSVANVLVTEASRALRQLAGKPLPAMEVKDHLSLLSELRVVKIIEKRSSPRRHLYVLAGVAESDAERALYQTMQYLVDQHLRSLQKRLGEAAVEQMGQSIQQMIAESAPSEDAGDE